MLKTDFFKKTKQTKTIEEGPKSLQHLQKDAKLCFSWMPHVVPVGVHSPNIKTTFP